MGRHFEVRAAAMASTAAKKSALFARASKEIFIAAKSGIPDPGSNLALRSAIDKYKGMGVTKDVIERAIKKATGSDQVAYIPGRYEIMGPGRSLVVVDTLTDNVNRAISDLKAVIKKTDSTFTPVLYNFTETGIFVFNKDGITEEQVEEALVLGDIDVWEVSEEDDKIQVTVNPKAFGVTRDTLYELGVKEFIISELRLVPESTKKLEGEDKEQFLRLLDLLDNVEDVQDVYHDIDLD
jgi:YebC/PmpR family DNA-binding regulatory protein